jgi:hypothetical protein
MGAPERALVTKGELLRRPVRHLLWCLPFVSLGCYPQQRAADIHGSGRKIVEILRKNPRKNPSKYDEDDVAHMRKVAAYNKRHLAQEEKAKKDINSNSYKSLKNWGMYIQSLPRFI